MTIDQGLLLGMSNFTRLQKYKPWPAGDDIIIIIIIVQLPTAFLHLGNLNRLNHFYTCQTQGTPRTCVWAQKV